MTATDNLVAMMRQSIEMEILKQVQSTPEYIETLVKQALDLQVNEYGEEHDNRTHRKAQSWLAFCIHRHIRGIASDTIKAWFEERQGTIEQTIKDRLDETDVISALAQAFVSSSEDWKINIAFAENKSWD